MYSYKLWVKIYVHHTLEKENTFLNKCIQNRLSEKSLSSFLFIPILILILLITLPPKSNHLIPGQRVIHL